MVVHSIGLETNWLVLIVISMSILYMKLARNLEKTRPVGLCLCCHLIKLFSLWNGQDTSTLQLWQYFGYLDFLVAHYLIPTVPCVSTLRIIVISQSKFQTLTPVLTAESSAALQQTGRGIPLHPTLCSCGPKAWFYLHTHIYMYISCLFTCLVFNF